MTSPGKILVDLAKHLETDLRACNRAVSCVDLAFDSAIAPPVVSGNWSLKVDVGPSQNPYRSIDLTTKDPVYKKPSSNGCNLAHRFTGVVRVSGAYKLDPADCCHEHTAFVYEYTNTLGIIGESLNVFLAQIPEGESRQTEYVSSFGGGAITTNINFTLILCMPSCDDLLEEEVNMLGVLNDLKK